MQIAEVIRYIMYARCIWDIRGPTASSLILALWGRKNRPRTGSLKANDMFSWLPSVSRPTPRVHDPDDSRSGLWHADARLTCARYLSEFCCTSTTACHEVTSSVGNKTNIFRPRPRPDVQDQDQDQDRNCKTNIKTTATRPRPLHPDEY